MPEPNGELETLALPPELARRIMTYLAERPYREVAALISDLANCDATQPTENLPDRAIRSGCDASAGEP